MGGWADIQKMGFKAWLQKQLAKLNKKPDVIDDTTGGDAVFPPVVDMPDDQVDFAKLRFVWGGFNGGKSQLNKKARIKNLKVTNSGMSYEWAAGGCEDLGASNAKDYSQTLACLFVKRGDSYDGGKFDWISTSRLTRDFKNLEGGGYNGFTIADYKRGVVIAGQEMFQSESVKGATEFAFVIVSKSGNLRTNVAYFKR